MMYSPWGSYGLTPTHFALQHPNQHCCYHFPSKSFTGARNWRQNVLTVLGKHDLIIHLFQRNIIGKMHYPLY